MQRILVAVDESPGSRRAADFVDRFFAGMDVSVTAVNVTHAPAGSAFPVPYGGVFAWPWTATDRPGREGERAREESAAEARATAAAPHDADVEVVFGETVEAISRAAEDENADLVVVGANDRSFLQRLLEPSVSQDLARNAPRPVLVVR